MDKYFSVWALKVKEMHSGRFIDLPPKFQRPNEAILKDREGYLGGDAPGLGSSICKELELL